MNKEMTSSKPYIIRALYEWICDNGCTPYVTVRTTLKNVKVPEAYVQGGWITLDLSQTAVNNLLIDNSAICARARFGGVIHELYLPIGSIAMIFASETKAGMEFIPEETSFDDADRDMPEHTARATKPRFKVIQNDD